MEETVHNTIPIPGFEEFLKSPEADAIRKWYNSDPWVNAHVTSNSQRVPEILTPEDAGTYLHFEPGFIKYLCSEGEIPAVQFGRDWRIPRRALDQYLCAKANANIDMSE